MSDDTPESPPDEPDADSGQRVWDPRQVMRDRAGVPVVNELCALVRLVVDESQSRPLIRAALLLAIGSVMCIFLDGSRPIIKESATWRACRQRNGRR